MAEKNTQRGFTLIELMIALAVITVLSAVAYANYQSSVLKSHRTQAKADMLLLTLQLERYHTINRTYAGFPDPDDDPVVQWWSPASGGMSYYSLCLVGTSVSAYQLQAIPGGAAAGDYPDGCGEATNTTQVKDSCGILTINQAGQKTPTTTGCW